MNGARYAYLTQVCKLVANNEDIIIVSNDYAAPILDGFRKDYPARYVSVGIAEQNLISVSCGLAMAGKRVVAYNIAPFSTNRAFDQIKNAVSMMHLPVNIVVGGAGFSIDGATHSNTDDIALMRLIPSMQIITPTDNNIGTAAANYLLVNKTPVYLRFDKNAEGDIYKGKNIDFSRGFEVLQEGNDIVVITCGSITFTLLELAKQWQTKGINAKIVDLYSIPFDENALINAIGNIPIITIEEHILNSGIGSLVLELFHDKGLNIPLKRMGINFGDSYPRTSGSREYYLAKYGLSAENITESVFSFLKNS